MNGAATDGRREAETVLWSTAAWALFTGLLETGVHAWHRFGLHEFINRSRHAWWLIPVGYLVLFAVPGLILALLAWRHPRRWNSAVTAFPLITASALSLMALLVWQKIHELAMALIAIGIGYQVARFISRHKVGYARLVRRASLIMGVVVATLAALTLGYGFWKEQRALAGLPDARPGAPNVLLIILDTVRARELSLYGYERETTPHLEVRARHGVVFDQAISTAPWTLPSHASMFTGLYPVELSTGWDEPLNDRRRTLAEAFRNAGYVTGGFVANLVYTTYEQGLDRGFAHYEDHELDLGTMLRDVTLSRRILDAWTLRPLVGTDAAINEKPAPVIVDDFLDWQARHDDRPFFAFLNFLDAHDPYLPPEPWFEKFAGHPRENQLSPLRRHSFSERHDGLAEEEVEEEIAAYDGAIAWLDYTLETLFQELDQRGEIENTIVVVTADHGEELGEHGLYLHGHSLYIQTLHVPLLIFGPGVPEGIRISRAVSLRDLARTVQEIAGLEGENFPGYSLAVTWQNDTSAVISPAFSHVQEGIRIPAWYPASRTDMQSLVASDIHVIQATDSAPLAFNLRTDPEELKPMDLSEEMRESIKRKLDELFR